MAENGTGGTQQRLVSQLVCAARTTPLTSDTRGHFAHELGDRVVASLVILTGGVILLTNWECGAGGESSSTYCERLFAHELGSLVVSLVVLTGGIIWLMN